LTLAEIVKTINLSSIVPNELTIGGYQNSSMQRAVRIVEISINKMCAGGNG